MSMDQGQVGWIAGFLWNIADDVLRDVYVRGKYRNVILPFAMGQDVCLIRSTAQNQRYLNYFLHSPAIDRQLAFLMVGLTFDRINVSEIKGLIISVPPRHEQDAIATYLDKALVTIDRSLKDADRAIALLREYRTRLIADVVTGKLGVREAAARLPDEVGAQEVIDEPDAMDDGDESLVVSELVGDANAVSA